MTAALLMILLAATPPGWSENFERLEVGPGWSGWGAPFGPAGRHASLEIVDTDRGKAAWVGYEQAQDYLVLPGPAVDLYARPTLFRLRARAEGPEPTISVTLVDASGEWLQTPAQPVSTRDWRDVKLPLRQFVDHALGDRDGQLDLPLKAFNLNVSFAQAGDGSLLIDDLLLFTEPVRQTAFLDLGLADPERAGVCVLGEQPPSIRLVNRAGSSLRVDLTWKLGDRQKLQEDLWPAPGQELRLPVPVTQTGPQILELTARTEDGEIKQSCVLTVLPKQLGGPDSFYGLGGYDAADLASGRFGQELGLLRAIGADWTLFWLPGRPGDPSAASSDPLRFAEAMTLAWAQGVRAIAYVTAPPEGSGRFAGDLPGYLAALEANFGEDPKTYLVPAEASSQADLLRASIAPDKLLLGYLGDGPQPDKPGLDGWLAPLHYEPAGSDSPPGPQGWSALQTITARIGSGPLYLWGRNWPLEELAGIQDRGSAAAILMACLRATPGLRGVCFGQVIDSQQVQGLTGLGQPRPELVAFAVASRLCGGLSCRGLTSPGPDAYAISFGDDDVRCAVAWTEGESATLTLREGTRLYDHLGGTLPWSATVRLHREPIYVVGSPPLADGLP